MDKNNRKDALEEALHHIEKQFGKGAIMRLGDAAKMNIEVIPTGILSLDVALGVGGVPRGRIIEIYGPESSGKTTVALHIVAEAQNEIIAIGTKEEEKKPSSGSGSSSSSKPSSGSSSSGKPSSGSSITAPSGGPSVDQIAEVYTLRATAYWEDGSSTTASGTYPQVGTIAANPNFLPYGTRL